MSTTPSGPAPRGAAAEPSTGSPAVDPAELDAVLRGSRVVTAVVAGSLARTDDVVTVLQLRVLVLAATRPGASATDVAEALGVHVSSASRTVERLVAAGLLERRDSPRDRRRLDLAPTPAGERLLDAVMADRRRELDALLARMPEEDRAALARGMAALAAAADEPPGRSPLIP